MVQFCQLLVVEGFMNCSTVQLEMVNILFSVRVYQAQWAGRKVFIKCDSEAVVTVLRSSRAREQGDRFTVSLDR